MASMDDVLSVVRVQDSEIRKLTHRLSGVQVEAQKHAKRLEEANAEIQEITAKLEELNNSKKAALDTAKASVDQWLLDALSKFEEEDLKAEKEEGEKKHRRSPVKDIVDRIKRGR